MSAGRCPRCGDPLGAFTMSMFNMENICMPCKAREREHPRYPEAEAADVRAIERGDYNFPGIGCPPDLYREAGAP